AKASGAKEPSVAGVIKGKLGYVAPEYTRGEIDHRADLWAVGIIMYELLTGGRQLFEGPNAVDTISRVRALPIPRPSMANPTVHTDVDDIVMAALERDPRRRWGTAADMRDRIRAVSEQLGELASDRRAIDWVHWAFDQKQGRAVQLTPMMPMPVYTAPAPPDATTVPAPAPPRRKLGLLLTVAVLLVLVLGAVAWSLTR
ncbi:MAG: serine/threonine protein kinase, partial [Solirubrobacteraceae bacterium]